MSCLNISASQLAVSPSAFCVQTVRFNNTSTCPSTYLGTILPKIPLKLIYAKSRHQQAATVCLFGRKGKSEGGNEASPWKALEKAGGMFKKNSSIEDVLKQQIEKKEYYDDFDDIDDDGGGIGGKRPGGGGGSGRGGGSGGFGEPPDDDLSGLFDEIFQVTMATLGLIFVYMFILDKQQVIVWTKDILRFIFTGGRRSKRLGIFLDKVTDYYKKMQEIKKEIAARPPDYEERLLVSEILDRQPGAMDLYKRVKNYMSEEEREELLKAIVARSRANANADASASA